jgi:hypothetical protein
MFVSTVAEPQYEPGRGYLDNVYLQGLAFPNRDIIIIGKESKGTSKNSPLIEKSNEMARVSAPGFSQLGN